MKLPFKKPVFTNRDSNSESEVTESVGAGCLNDAEQVADAVSAGLRDGNYAAIRDELSAFASGGRRVYAFKQPGIAGDSCVIVATLLLAFWFGCAVLVGIGSTVFSSNHLMPGLPLTLIACFGLVFNIVLVDRFVSLIKMKVRFEAYFDTLRYKSFVFIDDLVSLSLATDQTVVKDLERAVDWRFVPQGHFCLEKQVFVTSDAAFETYQTNPVAFDRFFQRKLEERKRIRERTDEVQRILDEGELYVQKFNNYGAMLKDKNLARKAKEVERIAALIFREIEVNPEQAYPMNAFLNIYLPTIERLLDAYVDLEERRAFGENVSKARKEIENALDAAIVAFGKILEELYQEQEEDVASDIAAMESSMRQEQLLTE